MQLHSPTTTDLRTALLWLGIRPSRVLRHAAERAGVVAAVVAVALNVGVVLVAIATAVLR